jgi:FlaG/FlaF family flagellin (archaellin)
MPAPQPEQKQDYLQLTCPQASSSSSTEILAVLYVNGRPACDSNTRVTVTLDKEQGKGALVVCDSQSGEHELSISSSKAGQYSITVESLSYGQTASCSFTRSKGSVRAEEAPDLPIAVAVATALLAFAALKRKQ